jgi:hypothetical protein
MEPARCGKVKHAGIAAQFQNNGSKIRQPCGFFADPKRISQLGCFGKQQPVRGNAKALPNGGCVGEACFGKHVRCAQPQQGQMLFRGALKQDGPDCQGESRSSTRGTGRGGMDFGERCQGQAATQNRIKRFHAGCKTIAIGKAAAATPHQNRIAGLVVPPFIGGNQPFRQHALDPGYLMAQGAKRFLRQG